MRVLITNATLRTRGGTESFVRDLARGLNALGHSVIAYTSDPGHAERLLENDVIPVATDLENLPFKPDIIHAQHHLDAMSALAALPGVPALYHFHGAVWRGALLKHPRIHRYLAMSHTAKERMMIESGVPDEKITVFLNPVDMARFRHVRQPRARAQRALFYNRHIRHDSETVQAVRRAADACGIEVEFVGFYFGNSVSDPQAVLPEYDIVFANGISAIEAAACGCAVVVLGRTSCGPLVTPENYEQIRRVNFSIASNSPAPDPERIAAELRSFSASAATEVTARVRRDADLKTAVHSLDALYQGIIETHKMTPADLLAESLAASRYLRRIAPLIRTTDELLEKSWSSEARPVSFDELSARLCLLENKFERASGGAPNSGRGPNGSHDAA